MDVPPIVEQRKGTSPWVYIGIGCGLAALLAISVVAGISFMGFRAIRNMANDIKDPTRREAKTKQVLGCTTLPEGYKPSVSFSMPFGLLDVAILSDREIDYSGHGHNEKLFDKRGFVYVKTIRTHGNKQAKDFFDGKADPHDVLEKSNIDISRGREISKGVIKRDDAVLYYVSMEGDINIRGNHVDGITTMIFIQCPNDERFRLGIWFGPKPGDEGEAVVSDRDGAGEVSDLGLSRVEDDASHRAFEAHVRRALPRVIRSVDALAVGAAHRTVARLLPDPKGDPRASAAGEARPEAPAGPATKAAPPEYAGTPADEAAIKAFMSHFSPCGS